MGFEEFNGIKISGKCFPNNTELHFLSESSKCRVAVVFGRNGSGKSTIAQAFRNYKGSVISDPTLQLLMKGISHVLTVTTEQREHIFVFDEKYIRDKISFRNALSRWQPIEGQEQEKDGLGTIVLFGRQGDIQTQIDAANTALEQMKAAKLLTDGKVDQRKKRSNPESQEYYEDKIHAQLDTSDGWKSIEESIAGPGARKNITAQVMDSIINWTAPSPDYNFDQADFQNRLQIFLTTATSKETIKFSLSKVTSADVKDVLKLLCRRVQRPDPTEREQQIIDAVTMAGTKASTYTFGYKATQTLMEDKGQELCPLCFQPLSDGYRKTVIESINHILNKDVENYQDELNQARIKEIVPPDSDALSVTGKTGVDALSSAVTYYNMAAQAINNAIECRIKDPFSPVMVNNIPLTDLDYVLLSLDFDQKIKAVNAAIDTVIEQVKTYNDAIKFRSSVERKLSEDNIAAAHEANKVNVALYFSKKKEMDDLLEEQRKQQEQIKQKQGEITALNNQLRNERVAADLINLSLQEVYLDKDRVMLVPADGYYEIKIRGTSVKPEDISAGERNALALCYFFTEILNGNDSDKVFQDEMLLVIDDPISSFDKEHRIGILTLLKDKLLRVFRGNSCSRVLLFTHDIDTLFHLKALIKQIGSTLDGDRGDNFASVCRLHNSRADLLKVTEFNDYSFLLRIVLDYAEQEPDPDDELNLTDEKTFTIGNTMRRLMDAFFTFKYRDGMDSALMNGEVEALLGDKAHYFQSSMSRITLNSESHTENQIRGITDNPDLFSEISVQDKIRTARDVLCLIYKLDEEHIKAHIRSELKGEDPEAKIAEIQNWLNSIPAQAEI